MAIADFSSVHSIMMEKSTLAGDEGGDPCFTLVTITHKVFVYAPAEREGTLPLFHLYPYMYSVVRTTYLYYRVGRASFAEVQYVLELKSSYMYLVSAFFLACN